MKGIGVAFIGAVVVWSGLTGFACGASPYAKWERGPSASDKFFPIAVWLQNPGNATKYRAAGINTYVALWRGPTEQQLAELKAAGMKLICSQNKVALQHLGDTTIIGWMHGDEPDNAQSLGRGKGYGPPILPEKIVEDYKQIQGKDPSRPILLNLGQGVAWDGWHGRGVRTNHPEDYREYAKGGDIVSFDIYPAVHDKPEVAGKLWYVPRGVERLVRWTDGKKVIWNCIECTQIGNPKVKPTPQQVKCEVWMSLIHGSMGLIYFVHEWQPKFNEAALLSDGEMLKAVTEINKQIHELAPVLNGPTVDDVVTVRSNNEQVPIATMVKQHGDSTYVFAVVMKEGKARGRFTIKGLGREKNVEVLGENRRIDVRNGTFEDDFGVWDVHLYRLR